MTFNSLEDAIQAAGGPVELLRNSRVKFDFPVVPAEYSNWRDEQRAWQESCGLLDMSHHMTDLFVEGPDALDLLADLGTNDFRGFEVNQAKQFIACNPDGYLIGDVILSYLDEDSFNLVGHAAVPNWVHYHAETGEYDVSAERDDNSIARDGPPTFFRYQIQGPNALDVMDEATDDPLPDVPFFNIGTFVIEGMEIRGLAHGMAREPGYELFGPWEFAADIWDAIVEAGERYDLQRVGAKAFPTATIESGWLPAPLPAIYDGNELKEYRRWLSGQAFEAVGSLGGSYAPEAVTDYYLDPFEVGYGRFVDFNHDFVGRAALEERHADQNRTKVTLVWNSEDVTNVFGTLFRDENQPAAKYLDLPKARYSTFQYDKVLDGDEIIGVSKDCAYTYNERAMLSLAVVDTEYSEPGTAVKLVWGEARPESPNPAVERHSPTEIRATVAPVPYTEDRLS